MVFGLSIRSNRFYVWAGLVRSSVYVFNGWRSMCWARTSHVHVLIGFWWGPRNKTDDLVCQVAITYWWNLSLRGLISLTQTLLCLFAPTWELSRVKVVNWWTTIVIDKVFFFNSSDSLNQKDSLWIFSFLPEVENNLSGDEAIRE